MARSQNIISFEDPDVMLALKQAPNKVISAEEADICDWVKRENSILDNLLNNHRKMEDSSHYDYSNPITAMMLQSDLAFEREKTKKNISPQTLFTEPLGFFPAKVFT